MIQSHVIAMNLTTALNSVPGAAVLASFELFSKLGNQFLCLLVSSFTLGIAPPLEAAGLLEAAAGLLEAPEAAAEAVEAVDAVGPSVFC